MRVDVAGQNELPFAIDDLRLFGRDRRGLIADGADAIALDNDERVRHDFAHAGIDQRAINEGDPGLWVRVE